MQYFKKNKRNNNIGFEIILFKHLFKIMFNLNDNRVYSNYRGLQEFQTRENYGF